MNKGGVKGVLLCRLSFILLGITALLLAAISAGGNESAFSSQWMIALWALLAISGSVWIYLSGRWRNPSVIMVHGSLLLILAGAAVTYFRSSRGVIQLIRNVPSDSYITEEGDGTQALPFRITLKEFEIKRYPGTSTPMDYSALISFNGEDPEELRLNHTVERAGHRFILSSYDPEFERVTLHVARDSAGTALSYAGYALFLAAAIVALCSRDGGFRRTLKEMMRTAALLGLLLLAGASVQAAGRNLPTVPKPVSDALSRLPVYYNDRIAPMGTLEHEFAIAVTGSEKWNGYSSSQISNGFLFFFGDWKKAPLIKVDSNRVRQAMGLGKGERACYTQWADAVMQGKLSTEQLASSSDNKERQDLARFESINSMVSGAMFRIFPVTDDHGTEWYAPSDRNIPFETDTNLWLFIRKSPGLLNEYFLQREYTKAIDLIHKIAKYQKMSVPEAIPSENKITAELFYNRVSRPFIPACVGLAAGIVLFVGVLLRKNGTGRRLPFLISLILWGWVLTLISLRWWITDHVPLVSGFETMQFMGFCCYSIALFLAWRRSVATSFAITAGSLALLVSAMGAKGAMVTPLMPVLGSPLLSVHVVLVMGAYSLMAIMALAGVMGLLSDDGRSRRIALMERAMAYPAIFLMGSGIFVGAVWANVSWGRYWGWDPKEVWALVTLITYSFAVHTESIRRFREPKAMHIFCLLAFTTVLFTYFGVNYLLRGLHSYA